MEAKYVWLNSLVNATKTEFSKWPDIKWLNTYNLNGAEELRHQLLSKIDNWLFKDTKPYHKQISNGCRLCGEGQWSCLFITGKCNAKCFYCPAPQTVDDVPGTQSLSFDKPAMYADYINYFNFKAVSFSGGEPLMYFDLTLSFLEEIRKNCSPDIYIWLYTNGILAQEKKLKKLADFSLNEIRFDIGATNYSLEKVKRAKGIIPKITIEIPAVPEEKEKLIKLLPHMIKAGVTNLNLHQLRLTKHNAPNIIKRGYTIIPAEKPIVLESELAALEILNYAKENSLDIGINYCSFFYKNRFQQAGFRNLVTKKLNPQTMQITENGYVRELNNGSIGYQTYKLFSKKPEYGNANIANLPNSGFYYQGYPVMKPTALTPEKIPQFENMIKHQPDEIPSDPLMFKLWQYEYIERGLRDL